MSAAQRRLLDLLAGWTSYVSQCATESTDPPPEVYDREADLIAALYQDVGRVSDMPAEQVRLLAMGTLTKLIVDGEYTSLSKR